MATRPLREVVTRFRLESNEQDFSKFNQRVSGMKTGMRQLAAVFGVTLGVAGAVGAARMGSSALRAKEQLKRLAGTDFGRLRAEFGRVVENLNTIREGLAGSVARTRDFDAAAGDFFKNFKTDSARIGEFGEIFEFAAKQVPFVGRGVQEIVKDIQSAVETGGFEPLLALPGFDLARKKLLEFQQQAMDPGEPGGRIAIENRMKAVLRIIRDASQEQNQALRAVPDSLLVADSAGLKLRTTLEELGKTINTTLVPAFQRIVQLLDLALGKFISINEESGRTGTNPAAIIATKVLQAVIPGFNPDKEEAEQTAAGIEKVFRTVTTKEGLLGKTPEEQQRTVQGLRDARDFVFSPLGIPKALIRSLPTQRLFGDDEEKPGPLDLFGGTRQPRGRPATVSRSGAGTIVNITNNIEIKSTDPVGAGKEAARAIESTLRDSRQTVIPTEAR